MADDPNLNPDDPMVQAVVSMIAQGVVKVFSQNFTGALPNGASPVTVRSRNAQGQAITKQTSLSQQLEDLILVNLTLGARMYEQNKLLHELYGVQFDLCELTEEAIDAHKTAKKARKQHRKV